MMYRITLTEKQMQVMAHYIEVYERLLMGQGMDFAEDVADNRYGKLDTNIQFSEWLYKRDRLKRVVEDTVAFVNSGDERGYVPKSEDMLIAEDIWTELRHQLWKDDTEIDHDDKWDVRSNRALGNGGEPIIKIEKVEE